LKANVSSSFCSVAEEVSRTIQKRSSFRRECSARGTQCGIWAFFWFVRFLPSLRFAGMTEPLIQLVIP